MRGIIVVNGYYSTDASRYQAARVEDELKKLGLDAEIYVNNRAIDVSEKIDCDFAVYFDKDIYLARKLEADGVRLFNSARSIENADDKIKTAIILAKNGLPAPTVIPAPKRYDDGTDGEFLRSVGEKLGYPLVLKAAEGSLGMGVYLIDGYEKLLEYDKELASSARFYQEYVPSDGGESIRVIVIGGNAACAMRLKNKSDFRSNAAVGGTARAEELTAETALLAQNAAKALELDYCGVDLFYDGKNIIEVNSNAYFSVMESVTGVNVAALFAKHVASELGE